MSGDTTVSPVTSADSGESSGAGTSTSGTGTTDGASSEGSSGHPTTGESGGSSSGDAESSSRGDASTGSSDDGSSSDASTGTRDDGSSSDASTGSSDDGSSSDASTGTSDGGSSSDASVGSSSGDASVGAEASGSSGDSSSEATGAGASSEASTGGLSEASSSGGELPVCGNGILEAGELCDDAGESAACDLDCTPAACGDTVVNASAGEFCDDGNELDADGCDADCTATDVAAVAAGGQHSCVLLDAGAVRCWGAGGNGALGLGDTDDIGDDEDPASTPVIELGGFATAIGSGYFHSCALMDDGFVRCWGDATYGQLGLADTAHVGDDELPVSVGVIDLGGAVVQLSVGDFHNCALRASGDVICWGAGDHGQLGHGNTEHIGDDELPSTVGAVDVGGVVLQLTAGVQHTCARLQDGTARCWGEASEGQLGYGNTEDVGDDELPSSVGVIDLGGDPVEQIVAGGFHTCARVQAGGVRCWGANNFGQLGLGTTENLGDDELPGTVGPVDLGGVAIDLAAGFFHTCALLDDGAVRCWGFDDFGELGRGDTTVIGDDETPGSVAVVDLGGAIDALSSLNDHTCARMQDGHAVRCWGLGDAGRLGYPGVGNVGDDEAPSTVGDVSVF